MTSLSTFLRKPDERTPASITAALRELEWGPEEAVSKLWRLAWRLQERWEFQEVSSWDVCLRRNGATAPFFFVRRFSVSVFSSAFPRMFCLRLLWKRRKMRDKCRCDDGTYIFGLRRTLFSIVSRHDNIYKKNSLWIAVFLKVIFWGGPWQFPSPNLWFQCINFFSQ